METLIGSVPDSWHHALLADVCDIRSGPSGRLRSRRVSTHDRGVPVVSSADFRFNGVSKERLQRVTSVDIRELSAYQLLAGDVLTARTGDLGRQALIGDEEQGWLFGTACMRLRPRNEVLFPKYLLFYLAHERVVEWIRRHATGSAIPSISAKALGSLPIPLPPLMRQEAIARTLALLTEKAALHDEISRTTAALRDSLLPVLYRGDASVENP
ncbi:restriction endonuclease subunit S [Cryptosporangium sp. NPDC048952]|uniref:restriction endonuclease subunit S n=1 Tax=Cryptosporangium sp. NPDC048952 TaxID=3363961 RepID=UPI003713D9C7